MTDKKIACIVVTYNRKALLKQCLDAICAQSYKPMCVYITDNASTDGTIDSVKEWGYYNCEKSNIVFKYVLNTKNEGGAGGFYLGMTTAFCDSEYDGLWVMDDDGEPGTDCLKELVELLPSHDYIAPIVLSSDKDNICSFLPNTTYDDVLKMATSDGIIEGIASPFNGILYSSRFINTVGYPKKDMFIWGDESNYHYRAKCANIEPVTQVRAIHYHPKDRQSMVDSGIFGKIVYANSNWKLYCYLRNYTYNRLRYFPQYSSVKNFIHVTKWMLMYQYYYVCKEHKLNYFWLLFDAYFSGIMGNFNGLNKYFNK